MDSHAATTGTRHSELSEKRSRTVHRILAAALQVIADEGVTGLSMSGLAQRAGVSRQTLYTYFPDIEAVLMGLVEMGEAGDADLADRVTCEGDPASALAAFVEVLVAAAAAGHTSRLVLAPALPASVREAMQEHEHRIERLVVDVLRQGQLEGSFRADLDPELDGRLLYRSALAAADLAAEPDADEARLTEHLRVGLLRMVMAEGPSQTGD